jgi:uncharacterized protein YkwD
MRFFSMLAVFRPADYRQALCALAAALACLVPASHTAAQVPEFSSEVEQRVLDLTNGFRAKKSLPPLKSDARLADAARYFAGYLARTGKLEHDADGTTPPERVKKYGYAYCIVAENLAMEYNSAGFTPERLSRSFVDGWIDSPTHRDNMLQPDITEIGIGLSRNATGEYYAVQVFARPMSQMTRFRISNRTNATVRYDYRNRHVTLGPKQGRNHESCIAGIVSLDSAGQPVTLEPKDGARYAITSPAQGVYRFVPE